MMYFVIGGDGRQYGPDDVSTLANWAREGRLVAASQVIEADTGRRMQAAEVPELAAVFGLQPNRAAASPTPSQSVFVRIGQQTSPVAGPKSKVAAGLLGLLFGSFGAHRFYLGYTGIGLLQIVVTIVTCGMGGIWGFVEGILCLTGHLQDSEGRALRD